MALQPYKRVFKEQQVTDNEIRSLKRGDKFVYQNPLHSDPEEIVTVIGEPSALHSRGDVAFVIPVMKADGHKFKADGSSVQKIL